MRDLALLPKAHLHVHLESTIRPATLAELAAANGVPLPPTVTRFDGFRAFGDHNTLVRACLRRPEDFTRIAAEFRADQATDGVRYAEVTFTAASHGERLGDPTMPLDAVLEGLDHPDPGLPQVRVILDHSRRRPLARLAATVALAADRPQVVAVGLAGEETHPLTPFAPVLDRARDAGLHLVHHAGETCGPASIREALDVGRTERLGHGIRVLDDPNLVAEVRDRRIPLEVCPSSNVGLGLVPSWADHPLPRLLDAGLRATLNTDVPEAVGATLTGEYRLARDTFGLTDDEIADLARAAVDASFAPDPVRTGIHHDIDTWLRGP